MAKDGSEERFGTKLWADGESGLINADDCLASAATSEDLAASHSLHSFPYQTAFRQEDSPRLLSSMPHPTFPFGLGDIARYKAGYDVNWLG